MIYICTGICVVCAIACLGNYHRARRARQATELLLGAVLMDRVIEPTMRSKPSDN